MRKAEERKHIVEGLRIAVSNIDEVIKIIRSSADTDEAKSRLMSAFGLSIPQSQAIVDMRLGRPTGLEAREAVRPSTTRWSPRSPTSRTSSSARRVVAIIREDISTRSSRSTATRAARRSARRRSTAASTSRSSSPRRSWS
ncbi:MAG: DNA gyrase subunit A [Planctomycetota bacterium]